MHKWIISISMAAMTGTMIIAAEQPSGLINVNSTMELGVSGDGVPGYRLVVNRIIREAVTKAPDKMYIPKTVGGGNPGQCLMIPGDEGLCAYQLELGDFYIQQDGEVEISFDAKSGPDAAGKIHDRSRFHIDFRCMPNPDAGEKYYPMLETLGFRPDGKWQHFAKRFKVTKRDNFYNIWIIGNAPAGNNGLNALYLDNFKVRYLGAQDTAMPDEVAVMPNHVNAVYHQDEPVESVVRALLNSSQAEEKIELDILTDYNQQTVKKLTVPVRKISEGTDSDRRSTYEGKVHLQLGKYGSFTTTATYNGKKLKSVGGDFAVIHPVIKHPRLSPGWRIGYNPISLCAGGRTSGELDYTDYYWLNYGGFEHGYRMAQLAGINLARFWGDWRLIEPEKNQFRADVMNPAMAMFKKYNIDLIFILAGDGLNLHGDKESMEKMLKNGKNNLPRYLYEYYYQGKREGAILPPMQDYDRFLNFVLNTWGDQVGIWEFFNEPGLGALPADRYLEYLRRSYQTIKQRYPRSLVLGNGVTGDFGMNVIKWCEDLNAVDPDYEKYLDGVAFHPYGGALDYEKGHYFLYSKAMDDIRSKLKEKKPLWNTECFYLTNARKPQMKWYLSLEHCGAGEEQRHVLESLMNGVLGVTAMAEGTLYKRNAPVTISPPSQVFAATNALSFLLKDMDKLSVIDLNKFIKSGIFISADGKKALGFVYDLRPSGSDWLLPENLGGVIVADLFGNQITDTKYHLTYEPYFLQGNPDAVKRVLTESKIMPRNGLQIKARKFQDRLYLEGRSSTGNSGSQEIRLSNAMTSGLPESVMLFWPQGCDYSTVSELKTATGKDIPQALAWQSLIAGSETGNGVCSFVPDVECHAIPYGSEQKPLELTLNRGSHAWIWSDDRYLQIKVKVKDDELIAAKNQDLWNGDALEIFIDANPFSRMDRNNITLGKDSLNAYQYGFAAIPSLTGAVTLGFSKKHGEIKTAALNHTEKTADGYILTASIPWTEISSEEKIGNIFGIDLEIDHVAKSGLTKESLGNNPGNSYRERLHYPLFKLPDAVYRGYQEKALATLGGGMVFNPNFSLQQYGDPVGWSYRIQERTRIKAGKSNGLNQDGLSVEVPKGQVNSIPAAVTQTLPLQPGKCHKIAVSFLARLEEVTPVGGDRKNGGLLFELNFYDGAAKKFIARSEYNEMFKTTLTGTTGWKEYQMVTDIPAKASEINLTVGLKSNTVGKAYISNVSVIYY